MTLQRIFESKHLERQGMDKFEGVQGASVSSMTDVRSARGLGPSQCANHKLRACGNLTTLV